MNYRNCPLCGGTAKSKAFPFATLFNKVHFGYLKCAKCSSVFVDPVPDEQTFALMYAKENYHDCHYADNEGRAYAESAQLLKRYLPSGARVLDYGCGFGGFLKAIKAEGFVPLGVEFDADAAQFAAQHAGCEVMPVRDFLAQSVYPRFDAIHLGDVLEHLPDPAATLKSLLVYLKPNGVLFVEGPLEINPSPVYWAAWLFGMVKHLLRPNFIGNGTPTHLFRTGARQQLAFFTRVEANLELQYWRVYETGWPYAEGGLVKRAITGLACGLGGKRLFGMTFGNRFGGIYTLVSQVDIKKVK